MLLTSPEVEKPTKVFHKPYITVAKLSITTEAPGLLFLSICFDQLASFNLLSDCSCRFALISFSISPLRTAASICLLRSADLSKFLDIALYNLCL